MAKKNQKNRVKRSNSKNSYRNEITKFARMMGTVERGRKNPDSLIASAYMRGATEPKKRDKKSLF